MSAFGGKAATNLDPLEGRKPRAIQSALPYRTFGNSGSRSAAQLSARIRIGHSVLSPASSTEVTMTRLIFAAVAALAGVLFGQTAQAYQAPWCAVIDRGTGSVYWDCQYHSFEDCYGRANILAGNRGFCNPSPYYVGQATEHRRVAKRHARPE